MFRNFLLVSFRNFLRNKTSAAINIFGLSLGIASATLIFLYVHDEINYDSIHPDYKRIYELGVSIINKDGSKESFGQTPGGWASTLKEKLPEVESYIKFWAVGFPHSIHDKSTDRIILNQDGELYWTDGNPGEIMFFPLVRGNPGRVLENSNSMVISESAAKALFGDEDPMNRVLAIKHPWTTSGKEVEFVVTGVFKDYPANTFFRPKYLLNIYGIKSVFNSRNTDFEKWINGTKLYSGFFYTYLRLKDKPDVAAINRELIKLADITAQSDSAFYASGSKIVPLLKPLAETHFDETVNWTLVDQTASKKTLTILAGIAILIVIMASINYMNLATARSVSRAKEVGIRKTLGSKRRILAWQFMQESALTTLLALIVSVILILFFLPYFNQFTGKTFSLNALTNTFAIFIILGLTILITLLGGSYPALYLSGFQPIEVLKGKFSGGRGADGLRRFLVTFQFIVAILLTISTHAIIRQMNFMQKSKLNEQGDQLLSIRYGTVAPNNKYPALKNALLKDKDIEFVTIANHLPRHDYFGDMASQFRFGESEDKVYPWSRLDGDFDFSQTYNLELVGGRFFDDGNSADSNNVILNERAVAELHKTNSEVIGVGVENMESKHKGKVIGVVKDFPFQSAYHALNPLVITSRPNQMDRIVYIKLPIGKMADKIKFIEETWKAVIPGVGFDYWFVSDEFNRLYKNERKISSLSKVFAVLAMCITTLGLYGLASYLAEQKTKEIGIRKVLGATVTRIAVLFIAIFLKIFIIAAIIAVPVSYYFVNEWLTTFVYRIPLSATIFIAGTVVILLLTLISITYETVKAARTNPVNALKHE